VPDRLCRCFYELLLPPARHETLEEGLKIAV
jgi:hypothetical protein